MGSRKNILKTLCIPEYPWSSDDDDTPTDSTPDPRPAPAPQLRPGGEQAMPTTSSPAVSGSSERELFLSFLSLPSNRSGTSGSTNNRFLRSDHLSLAYLPRSPHTPAPELRERAGGCDDSHIRRVLAFKQLTKNMGMGHNSGLGRYTRRQFPRARGNARPGSVVPAEIISASNMRTGNRRPERRPYTNSRPGMGTDRVGQAASNINEPSPHRRRRTNSMEVNNNSEDEADELASTMSRPRYFAPLFATSTPEPAIDIDTDMPTISSNNTSGAGVSLEEDVVEILDSPAAVDLDLIVPVPVPAMPKRVRVKPATTTNDPNMPSTSAADQVDAPQTETDKGVKKNTRDSSDDKPSEVVTVKDFNQSLLRLLECPVCLEWMEPPMSQCRRGHLVCCRCRARLASCPVCRTTFSSVRNRAMEGVAELLRYPCRHGCGREVRLRRRTPHESSCVARLFTCPTPLCDNKEPMLRSMLAEHFSEQHTNMLKVGSRQRFGIKVNVETHETWLLLALDELFLLKVDVDVRTWGVVVYVAFIGPKCNAEDYAYEVNIDGQHNGRKLKYRRCTHSDLESSSLNVSRQDCFHLTLDQALNFIRFKNRHFDAEKYLEFDVELSKVDPPPSRDDSDS